MEKIAEHNISRNRAALVAIFFAVIIGLINSALDIDFTASVNFYISLLLALVTVIFLHEGVHGGTAMVFGHKPIFGFKPPLIYVTFKNKIPRVEFMIIAMAPLILLDILFLLTYQIETLKLFSNFAITINSLGATADVWIFIKLLKYGSETLVQDRKTGLEVWKK